MFDVLSLGCPESEPKGIFCGNPVGKLLGNAYLSILDDFLQNKKLLFVRYIDDICVFNRNREEAKKILLDIKEFLKTQLRLEIAEKKTGIYHRYFNKFNFLGFSVISENIMSSRENVERFIERIRELPQEYKRRGIKKFLRKINSIIYNFGHMYKMGNVRKLYLQLDEKVRRSIREYLKLSGKGDIVKTMYNSPLKFPVNLAFSKEILEKLGVASLVKIKYSWDNKDEVKDKARSKINFVDSIIKKEERDSISPLICSVELNGVKVVISASHNLGIGTADPGNDRLDVRGRAYASGGWQTTNADYAEWFEKEEGTKTGDIIGINLTTGNARKCRPSDKFIGIHCTNPGVVGNRLKETDEEMKEAHVLVSLLGQVDFNRTQVNIEGRIVKTKDGKEIGILLSNNKVLIGIS